MTKKTSVEELAGRLSKNLPDAIKKQKSFLLWRLKPSRERKKPLKVPHYIDGGQRSGTQGAPEDLRRMATFDGALSAFRSGRYSGIGLATLPGSGLIGLDFDDCLENRRINPDLAPLVEGTYCEVSPSGSGIRAFYYGEMPDRKNHTAGVEVFCRTGYLTLTGDRFNDCDVIEMPEGVRKQLNTILAKRGERTPAPGRISSDRLAKIESSDPVVSRLKTLGLFRKSYNDGKVGITCPFASEHTTGDGDADAVYFLPNTGGYQTGNFNCLHAHCSERSQDDFYNEIDLPRKKYADLLNEAKALSPESSPEAIQNILNAGGSLTELEIDSITRLIKKSTGINLGILKKAVNRSADKKDHLDLARELVQQIGPDNVLSVNDYVYRWSNKGVWEKTDDRAVKQWVQNHIRDLAEGAAVRKTIVDSVADLFRTEIYIKDRQFNVGPPECVNCPNGELVLNDEGSNWELVLHNREHYRTTQIPVSFDPAAQAPRFQKFLNEVFEGDKDGQKKATAILEMIGYSLMAHCRHEKFVMLVGGGANGKSVLLAVLEALCGKGNVAGVQPSRFDRTFQRAHLHCKLVNIVTEIAQGEVIVDASLKAIVSGEPDTVEEKFKNPFNMRPFATCWFATNHLPHTRDYTEAFSRRALVVEFNNAFKPAWGNHDPLLKEKLIKEELPGILNLALNAYKEALLSGFTIPESSKQAGERWLQEADQVAQFVADRCENDPFNDETFGTLYSNFQVWAFENGIHKTVASKTFRERLTRLGYADGRTSGARLVTGISLKK